MKRLLEIGPYSETGGVSVHIRRLVDLLTPDFKVQIIDESKRKFSDGKIFNIRTKNFAKYLGLIFSSDVVHIHTAINWLRFIHVFVAKLFFRKVVITIHSVMHVEHKKNNFLFLSSLALSDKIILVSNQIKECIGSSNGIVMPAFIPPNLKSEKDLPSKVYGLLEDNKGKRIVISNAYRLDIHNGNDLYGFDLLLDVAKTIQKNGDNIFMILVISSIDSADIYLKKYTDYIVNESLEKTLAIVPHSISFIKLIMKSDLVVRATNTDGDSLTIREGLYFNKKVVASDVVLRPIGTIIFRNRDSEDLYNKIVESLKSPPNKTDSSKIDYQRFYTETLSF